MTTAEISSVEVLEELENVLKSPGFARNERLSKFLRVAVEWRLSGRGEELKESVLGVEVFGRPAGYDPKRDPIVRTEASRLRARLGEYFSEGGQASGILIELPKGGYIPEWRRRDGTAVVEPAPVKRQAFGWKRAGMLIAAMLTAMLAVAGWRMIDRGGKTISIAVMPLRNLSENPGSSFFSDGLTGEIIRNLSLMEGLAVRSQASSFAYKNKASNAQDSGRELSADYVLEGSVFRSGSHLRVHVQLVKVNENRYVWSEKYDREAKEVFQIQDEISRGIVNSLRLSLGRGRRRYETSVEAYDLYLQARALQLQSVFGDERSIELFERAIEKDPTFAPAYAGVAIAYAERSEHANPKPGGVEEDLKRMRETAEKAAELDPLWAEAHEAQAMACARDGKWERAAMHFKRAIELDPNDSKLRSHYGCNYFLALGQVEKALEQLRIAKKSDPLSPQVHYRIGYILMSAGRFDEALRECELMQSEPNRRSQCVGRAKLFLGRGEEAIAEYRQGADSYLLSYALARVGRRGEAAALRDQVPANTMAEAIYWAGLGDTGRAIEAIERAKSQGPVLVGRLLTFPEFETVRKEEKLARIYRWIGRPE